MAGQRAAVVMSLVPSAKLHGHDPRSDLKVVLERLQGPPAPDRRVAATRVFGVKTPDNGTGMEHIEALIDDETLNALTGPRAWPQLRGRHRG